MAMSTTSPESGPLPWNCSVSPQLQIGPGGSTRNGCGPIPTQWRPSVPPGARPATPGAPRRAPAVETGIRRCPGAPAEAPALRAGHPDQPRAPLPYQVAAHLPARVAVQAVEIAPPQLLAVR